MSSDGVGQEKDRYLVRSEESIEETREELLENGVEIVRESGRHIIIIEHYYRNFDVSPLA